MPLLALVPLLAQVAPDIVKWVAGDAAGTVAGKVAEVVRSVAGSTEPDAVKAALADPNLALQLQMKLAEIGLERERIASAERTAADQRRHDEVLAAVSDAADARSRDMAFLTAGKRNRRADIMVAAASLGLVACLVVMTLYKDRIPGEVIGLLASISGIFGACLKDAFAFEFGSSRSSKDKDAVIGQVLAAK